MRKDARGLPHIGRRWTDHLDEDVASLPQQRLVLLDAVTELLSNQHDDPRMVASDRFRAYRCEADNDNQPPPR